MFKVPESFRQKFDAGHLYETKEGEKFGVFVIPHHGNVLFCIATEGDETIPWEHVSVSVKRIVHKKGNGRKSTKIYDLNRCPTWEEMCIVKDLFWDETDTVVQFHPPKSEYVSQHHYTLHLWRKIGQEFETPPSEAVGFTKGQNLM
jgi:hypothetical protein